MDGLVCLWADEAGVPCFGDLWLSQTLAVHVVPAALPPSLSLSLLLHTTMAHGATHTIQRPEEDACHNATAA